MQPTADNVERPVVKVQVEHLPEYVIGFPMYVAITVQAPVNGAFNRLLFADLTGTHESIGIEMGHQTGPQRIRYIPKPLIETEVGAFPQRLEPGESRRMLTDFSPLAHGVTEGPYLVRFSFVSPKQIFRAAPVQIRFRNPTPGEQEMLRLFASDRPRYANWSMWALACPGGVAWTTGDAGPLGIAFALRELLCGKEPLAEANPQSLETLTGLYTPERDALKAELLQLRGDSAGYAALRASILKNTPGLSWWIRMIDSGGAYLKSHSRRTH